MAAALPPMLSKDELVEAHAKVEQLRSDMATRSAGGREASGRYKKHDTARKVYIDTVAMPSLRLGKRIDDDDWRRLFLPGDDEIAGADKADMDRWYKKHKHDPRSTLAASYQLDESKQITLLSWVQRNPSAYVRPESAPSGTPMSYRLTQRDVKAYAGFTLCQLAHDGNRCSRSAPYLGRPWRAPSPDPPASQEEARADGARPGWRNAGLAGIGEIPVALPGASRALPLASRARQGRLHHHGCRQCHRRHHGRGRAVLWWGCV